jgi:hypothetical protein
MTPKKGLGLALICAMAIGAAAPTVASAKHWDSSSPKFAVHHRHGRHGPGRRHHMPVRHGGHGAGKRTH